MLKRLFLGFICTILIIFAEYGGLLEGVNGFLYDLSFRLRGSEPSLNRIVIVAVDNKTLDRLGRWAIPRVHYASLLGKTLQADVVAFDIIMAEPSRDDITFSEAIRRHGKVVLPVYVDTHLKPHYPVSPLSPPRTGHVHIEQSIRSVARGVFHALFVEDKSLPSFSASVYASVTGAGFQPPAPVPSMAANAITQMDFMFINFCGPPGTFETISLWDVLNGVYPDSFFRKKIILVGAIAEGVGDHLATPFSQDRRNMSGVEIQANAVNTLLLENRLKPVTPPIRWGILLILCLGASVFFTKSTEKKSAVVALGGLCVVTAGAFFLFARANLWLPPMIYYVAIPFVFVLVYIGEYAQAINSLDKVYDSILPNLRWVGGKDDAEKAGKGMGGMLTPGGIYGRVRLLTRISRQLILEKELTDKALFGSVLGVLLFGSDGKKMAVNQVLETLAAHNIDTDSVERFLADITPFIMEKGGKAEIMSLLTEKEGHFTATLSLTVPKRKFFKMEASAFHANDKKYLLFLFADITGIKEMEILKGEIVSIVSHELKTPMTTIQGFSELLTGTLQGEPKEFAKIIHQESQRLTRFINTFLDTTRIEDGRERIKSRPVVLKDLVSEIMATLSPLASQKDIRLLRETPGQVTVILIDRDLTKQCLLNLCENAIKYSPPGRSITIKLSEQKETLTVAVIDEGYGISDDEMGKVFEKFYRSGSEVVRDVAGSGLGLAFVKEAVESQGGRVTVESVINKGSTFSIIFPKVR